MQHHVGYADVRLYIKRASLDVVVVAAQRSDAARATPSDHRLRYIQTDHFARAPLYDERRDDAVSAPNVEDERIIHIAYKFHQGRNEQPVAQRIARTTDCVDIC
jgi:hypothetical protein